MITKQRECKSDDLKVSHNDHVVLDDFLDDLMSEFVIWTRRRINGEQRTRSTHEYLGITVDYSIAGKVVYTMFDYLEDVIFEAADD